MRMLEMRKWTAVLALLALGTPVSAETIFRWTAADGSVSFADDAKRIPERYRGAADRIETSGLTGYRRYSPARPEAQAEYAGELAQRLQRLRALNAELDAPGAPGYAAGGARVTSPAGAEMLVDVGDGLTVRVPETTGDDGPVVVQDVRVRRPHSVFTSTDTVITQDGRVLLVVRGDRHSANPSADINEEGELFPESNYFDD